MGFDFVTARNRFAEADKGKHYGYPYCFTEYQIQSGVVSGTRGTVWGWPSFLPTHGDAWCRQHTVPPSLALQAHSAPLGLEFYKKSNLKRFLQEDAAALAEVGGFPLAQFEDDCFLAYHGSWNRDTPTGYKVVRVDFSEKMPKKSSPKKLPRADEPEDLLWHSGAVPNAATGGTNWKWPNGVRFVDVKFDRKGRLLVTDDGRGTLTMLVWTGGAPAPMASGSNSTSGSATTSSTSSSTTTTVGVSTSRSTDGSTTSAATEGGGSGRTTVALGNVSTAGVGLLRSTYFCRVLVLLMAYVV